MSMAMALMTSDWGLRADCNGQNAAGYGVWLIKDSVPTSTSALNGSNGFQINIDRN